MKREARAKLAEQTVAIVDAGEYAAPDGKIVSIAREIDEAIQGTVLHSPETCPPGPRPAGARRYRTRFSVGNETTFAALARFAPGGPKLACLNFASAKNPGGGFLGGASAQEESLARASALYSCLLAQPEYYERNRRNASALYLDLAIFSPAVPFFRDDNGGLLDEPLLASVITAPAPNAGAVAANEPGSLAQLQPTLRRRAALVLDVALAHGVEILVLGAWGCGVFRNDPAVVAGLFRDMLTGPGQWAGCFAEVVFAVFDTSADRATVSAFRAAFPEAPDS